MDPPTCHVLFLLADSLKLTRISSTSRQTTEGNIHTGAPPPWLTGEGNQLEITLKSEQRKKAGKSSRLNPKRVGAAWAERRKLELELESRGEHVPNNFGANWLPNFGGVWQSGTRKESRKEFQSEHKSSHTVDDQSEALLQLQPYISKRMVPNHYHCILNITYGNGMLLEQQKKGV